MEHISIKTAEELAPLVNKNDVLLIDSRTFCEYNTSHILNSINVWSSKIRKKRLQQSSVSVLDFMQQAGQLALKECKSQVIVYDQSSKTPTAVSQDSFLYVLLCKLTAKFDHVFFLQGGYLEFQAKFPELCKDTGCKTSPLTSMSQPCLPVANTGFTRILPFMYLGSQKDANNKELLREYNIKYELNVSTSCPKPVFMADSHFFRISVNDNFSEKLMPHFQDAFQFIDKVKEAGERVLVHCLAGISRSPTVAIAYVMRYLKLHYDEAYRYVKQRRPTISPNINFVGQLLELDRMMYGEHSVCRSPTVPLYLDQEYSFEVLPCPDSLVRKSSSSPCIDSVHIQPSPKRSLPNLGATGCQGTSFEVDDKGYISDRLPSSPTTPHSEFFEAYSLHPIPIRIEYDCTNTKSQRNVVNPTAAVDVGPNNKSQCRRQLSSDELGCKTAQVTRETNNAKPSKPNSPVVAQKPPIPPDEHSSHLTDVPLTNAIPPPGPKPLARTKKTDYKQFPRSHSSSETHLTKKQMETGSFTEKEPCPTRKSMSTDEVSKGFTPQSPLVFSRENSLPVGSSELARCDSWSTSGLGSEISDWESVQGENATEDTQGPFEAVFSEVFPGDSTDSLFRKTSTPVEERKTFRSASDHRVSRGGKMRSHRPLTHSSSMKGQCSQRVLCRSSSAPRPVSLPGVTDSYNSQLKSSSIDMGVDMDDSGGWNSAKGSDFNYEQFSGSSKPLTENDAMNPRTMDDDVKHFMSWFKIDSWQDPCTQNEPESTTDETKWNSDTKDSIVKTQPVQHAMEESSSLECPIDSLETDIPGTILPQAILANHATNYELTSGYELQKFSRFDSKRHTYSGKNWNEFNEEIPGNCKWWDDQLKRKVIDIERNVNWNSMTNSKQDTYYPKRFNGYHLTEELMQSVEQLLETEIGDIKRQACALKTRYGLDSNPHDTQKASVSFSNEETISDCSDTTVASTRVRTIPISCEFDRAMSEPPLCGEEGLYRARSCPGLPNDKEKAPAITIPVVYRSRVPSQKEPNRYSCGALDSLPNIPPFESCTDISKLKRYFLDNSKSPSPSCSSSSFSRLLQVS